jgi:hypothetical protein
MSTIEAPVQECTLHIMDHTGDTRIMWDPRNKDEVDTAKAAFDAAKKKGMIAYKVDATTGEKTGEVIREFDKKAGKIIMAPQLVGG